MNFYMAKKLLEWFDGPSRSSIMRRNLTLFSDLKKMDHIRNVYVGIPSMWD